MRLSAVILARAIAFVETVDLSPRGKVFYPDLAKELVQRYQFQKFPQTLEDFDEQKGITFVGGKSGETVIEKLTIYTNGILVDTRTDTAASKRIIDEALQWARSKFGLHYDAGMIQRFGYVSQLTFYSEAKLDTLHPALRKLAERISSAVSEIQNERFHYQTTSIAIQHDPSLRKYQIAGFTIQPRAETRFSEGKYFSEAPLATDLHWEMLQQFEKDLLSGVLVGTETTTHEV